MIEFTDIFQMTVFIALVFVTAFYLVGTVITFARKGGGATTAGVVFYVLAWLLFVVALMLAVLAIVNRFEPFGITLLTTDGSLSLFVGAKKLFTLPVVGKLVAIIARYIVIEVLAYAFFAIMLLSVISWPIKWKASKRGLGEEGDGYLTVNAVPDSDNAGDGEAAEADVDDAAIDEQLVDDELDEWLAREEADSYTLEDNVAEEHLTVEEEPTLEDSNNVIEEVEADGTEYIEEELVSKSADVIDVSAVEGDELKLSDEEAAVENEAETVVEEAAVVEEATSFEAETVVKEEESIVEEATIEETEPKQSVETREDADVVEEKKTPVNTFASKRLELIGIEDSIKDIADADFALEDKDEKVLDFGSIVFRPRTIYKPERKKTSRSAATVRSSIVDESTNIVQDKAEQTALEKATVKSSLSVQPEKTEDVSAENAGNAVSAAENIIEPGAHVEQPQPIPVIAVKNGDNVQYIPIQYVMPYQATAMQEPVSEPEKKKRRVSTRAGQMFSQYIGSQDEESKKKLQSSIDTVRLDKHD